MAYATSWASLILLHSFYSVYSYIGLFTDMICLLLSISSLVTRFGYGRRLLLAYLYTIVLKSKIEMIDETLTLFI